ncbi:hypothetical protein BDZ97DRAFT_1818859 [Flammula alnicola]|nr:hypothetical protein BDZ97DRAFT_1818859 [Flammula alnicola]
MFGLDWYVPMRRHPHPQLLPQIPCRRAELYSSPRVPFLPVADTAPTPHTEPAPLQARPAIHTQHG